MFGLNSRLAPRWAAFALAMAIVSTLLAPTASIAADAQFSSVSSPSISGSSRVGATLTATPNYWSPTPTSFNYQWLRNGQNISGANNSTYLLTGDDYQTTIAVAVTAIRTGYVSNKQTSGVYGTFYIQSKGDFLNQPIPEVGGTLMVGEYLIASKGVWPEGATFAYQWMNNSWDIYGAISETYQVQATDKFDRISLELTVTKYGYNTVTKIINTTENIKPASPKITWQNSFSTLTGKNTLKATAQPSFGSTDRVNTWCFTRNGVAFELDMSQKGVYFIDSSNRILSIYKSNSGCYSARFDDLLNVQIRVDVTNWAVGSHTIQAIATDVMGMASKPIQLSLQVARTAPTVTGTIPNLTAAVKEAFTISANTTSHSLEAPIRRWCVTVDGAPVGKISTSLFKNAASTLQDGTAITAAQGCISSSLSNVELTQGELSIDSTQFTNGDHELGIKVMSQDSEGTFWWSDVSKTSFKIKNPYIPVVTVGALTKKVVPRGTASRLVGSIKANIPGTPSKITLSTQNSSGEWVVFYTGAKSNAFSSSKKFVKNTAVQIELFDEDNLSALVTNVTAKVSPVVKLGKAKVDVSGSTTSSKVTKTVSLSATSAGLNAICEAKWAGGSKTFKMAKGKGSVVFQPRSGSSASIVCTAAEMSPSVAVAARY